MGDGRSLRYEKFARLYDSEVLPIWSQHFSRLLLRELKVPAGGEVLELGCATGYLTCELVARSDEQTRVVALEPRSPLLDLARGKVHDLLHKRVFLRSERPAVDLAFADAVYDLVVSNLGLLEYPDPPLLLAELVRVAKRGAEVVVTYPLRGTYGEFFELYREVLLKAERGDLIGRIESLSRESPTGEMLASWLESAGLSSVKLEVEEFSLLFRSGCEFFGAPLIEFGPLAAWQQPFADADETEKMFKQIEAAIDSHFDSANPFRVTVQAGCARGVH